MTENRRNRGTSVFETPAKGARNVRSVDWSIIAEKGSKPNDRREKIAEKKTNAAISLVAAQGETKDVTPPHTTRFTMLIPMAPAKQQRKQFDKEMLKPKKLIYSDRKNERDIVVAEDKKDTATVVTRPEERAIRRNAERCIRPTEKPSKRTGDQRKNDIYGVGGSVDERRYDETDDRSVKAGARGRGRGKDDLTGRAITTKGSSGINRGRSSNVDKENVKTLVIKRNKRDYCLRSGSNKDSHCASEPSKQSVDYRELESSYEQLSQPTKDTNWISRLRWLWPRRDVGLWIQCCRPKCAKWRYTDEYRDPLDVPEIWFCYMNSNRSLASCEAPEEQMTSSQNDDLIENAYNAGSIVWGRVNGFPWWPAIVDDCPDTAQYYYLSGDSIIPTMYHVTFFEESLSHKWLRSKDIKPFIKNKKDSLVKKTIYRKIDYKTQLNVAYNQARTAVRLSILQRLQKFSFLARYTKLLNGKFHNCNDNDDDDNDDDNNGNDTVGKKLYRVNANQDINVLTDTKGRTNVSNESNIVRKNNKEFQEVDDTCSIRSSILYDSTYGSYGILPITDSIVDRRLLSESKMDTSDDDTRQLSCNIYTNKMQCFQDRSDAKIDEPRSLRKRTITDSKGNVGSKRENSLLPWQVLQEESQIQVLSQDEIPNSQSDLEPSQLFLKLSNARHSSLKRKRDVSPTTSLCIEESMISKDTKQIQDIIKYDETHTLDEIPSSQSDLGHSQLFHKLSNARHSSLKLCKRDVSSTTSLIIKESTMSKGIKSLLGKDDYMEE